MNAILTYFKKIFTVASAEQHLLFLYRLFLENPILFTPIFVRKQWSLYYQPKQCTSVKGNPSKLPHICIVWYLQNWQSNGPLSNPPLLDLTFRNCRDVMQTSWSSTALLHTQPSHPTPWETQLPWHKSQSGVVLSSAPFLALRFFGS